MADRIVIRLTSESEREFFEMISKNYRINLKDLCRKIARVQVYRIIKRLELLQNYLGIDIIKRKVDLAIVTSLPIVVLEINGKIELKEIEKERFVVIS